MKVMQPVYDELLGDNNLGTPLSGDATRYGDVTPLLSSVDDKYVIMVQGDEMSLKYSVPDQAEGTQRDFIYYSWSYNKPYPFYSGSTIGELPFRAMTEYPYDTSVENYPYTENQSYINAYDTRKINWTEDRIINGVHHSLNTDYISLSVSDSNPGSGSDQTCTSFTYSWGVCQPDGTQTGTVVSQLPDGCTGGNPVLSRSCTYISPIVSGGGGGYYIPPVSNQDRIAQLQAQIAALQTQISAMTGGTQNSGIGTPLIPAGFKFTKRLQLGMVAIDVKYLQIILNSDRDTRVAVTGIGSPGHETTRFRIATYNAVKKFQQKYASEILTPQGFKSPTGIVASLTNKKLNSLLATLGQ